MGSLACPMPSRSHILALVEALVYYDHLELLGRGLQCFAGTRRTIAQAMVLSFTRQLGRWVSSVLPLGLN